MDFTAADIKTFQKLYIKYFNIKLTDNLARTKLMMLVRQMEIAYKPITEEQFNKFKDVDGNEHNEPSRSKSDS